MISYSATSQAEGVWLSMGCVQPFTHLSITISIQQLKFAQDCRVANDSVWGYGLVISVGVYCCLICFCFCFSGSNSIQRVHLYYITLRRRNCIGVVVCVIPLPATARCICESSWLRWLLWKHLAFILKAFYLAGCTSAQLLCHALRRRRRLFCFCKACGAH